MINSTIIFKAHIIEKMQSLIVVYYYLDKNKGNDLKAFQDRWAFFDLNPHKIYSLTVWNEK